VLLYARHRLVLHHLSLTSPAKLQLHLQLHAQMQVRQQHAQKLQLKRHAAARPFLAVLSPWPLFLLCQPCNCPSVLNLILN
jgi:hypothetical protein